MRLLQVVVIGLPGGLILGLLGIWTDQGFGYVFIGGWVLTAIWAFFWLGKNPTMRWR